MDNVIIRFEFTSIVPIHQHQIANMSMNVTQRKQISFQNSNPWPELDEFNSKLGDCQSSEKKIHFKFGCMKMRLSAKSVRYECKFSSKIFGIFDCSLNTTE